MEVLDVEKTKEQFMNMRANLIKHYIMQVDIDALGNMLIEEIQKKEQQPFCLTHYVTQIKDQDCLTYYIQGTNAAYYQLWSFLIARDEPQKSKQIAYAKQHAQIESINLERLFQRFPYLESLWNGYIQFSSNPINWENKDYVALEVKKCQKRYMKNPAAYCSYQK